MMYVLRSALKTEEAMRANNDPNVTAIQSPGSYVESITKGMLFSGIVIDSEATPW